MNRDDVLPTFMICAITFGVLSTIVIGIVLEKLEFVIAGTIMCIPLSIVLRDVPKLIKSDKQEKHIK